MKTCNFNTAPIIQVAMDEELAPFLAATEPAKIDQVGMEQLQLGHAAVYARVLDDYPVLLVRSKIGGTNATAALTSVISLVSKQPRLVVSAGTAGGLKSGIAVGDVCVSTTLAYTDADATAFGYARGQTPGQPETFAGDAALLERLEQVGQEALRGATASSGSARLRVGQMLAGNSFVTAANVADTREVFPTALSTDMESTALAQVAAGAGVPFVSVRGVSDLCGPEAGQDFHIAAEEAAARSAAVVLALLS